MSRTTSTVKRWPPARLIVLFVTTVLALAALLYSIYGQRQTAQLRVTEPSPETFIAPVDIEVVDRIATERERQAARAQIVTVVTSDDALQQLVVARLATSGLPEEVLGYLVVQYQDPTGLSATELEAVIAEASSRAEADRQREVKLILERQLVATAVPNDRLTGAARSAAAAAIQPIMQRLQAGEVIVSEGEPLSEDHLRVLEAVGLYNARNEAFALTAWIVFGCLLLGAILALPLLFTWARLRHTITFNQLAYLAAITLLALAVQRLAFLISPSFLFVSLVAVLVAVLISETGALGWAVWLSLATAVLVPSAPLTSFAVVLIGAVTATLIMVRVATTRLGLLLAATGGGLASAAVFAALTIVSGGVSTLGTFTQVSLLIAGGIIAGIGSLGLLPLAESVFGFLTDFRLTELSSPTSPLLQKLLLGAPGTYQHSLIISNLVEQATTNIGGNALLARVGALYHDVGKLKRPHFFIENQFSNDNPHDSISPHLSYLIVTSHVRDSVELLREHRLPRALEAFATTHHGTTVLAYFYKRALEDTAALDELNFRYSGPKPRTKETAVLMLADSIESASRTLVDPTPNKIRGLIDGIVEQRLQDQQLSESPLNFNDLEVIATTFERMMTAILHRRISYPSAEEIQGLKSGGSSRRNEPVRAG